MPRRRQQRKIPTPTWGRERGAIGRQVLSRTPQFYGAAGVVLLVLAAIGLVGFAFLSNAIAAYNRPGSTALRIDDTKYTVRYFTERLKTFVQQAGGAGSQAGAAQPAVAIPSLVNTLIQETMLLHFASEQNQSVSDDEVKGKIVERLGLKADDSNLEIRFRDEYSRSGLSETEYKDMMRAEILREKVLEKFKGAIPAAAESVHYREITLAQQSDADDIKRLIEGGADFVQLAKDKSLDKSTKDNGGDAGWAPRGALTKELEDALFALEVNQVTTLNNSASGVLVLQVTEKQADRPIDEAQKSTVANRSLQKWLDEKEKSVKIESDMPRLTGDIGFSSCSADKVKWALDRAYPSLGSGGTQVAQSLC